MHRRSDVVNGFVNFFIVEPFRCFSWKVSLSRLNGVECSIHLAIPTLHQFLFEKIVTTKSSCEAIPKRPELAKLCCSSNQKRFGGRGH